MTAIEYDTHEAYAEYYYLYTAVDYSLQILSVSLEKEYKFSSICSATGEFPLQNTDLTLSSL